MIDTDYSKMIEQIAAVSIGDAQITRTETELFPHNHSPIVPNTTVHKNWLWFLQEVVLLKAQAVSILSQTNMALVYVADLFIPSLLYVNLLSAFDDALGDYIRSDRTALTGRFDTLHQKLTLLNRHGRLTYSQRLRDLKNKRNDVGHLPTTTSNLLSEQVSWAELDSAIDDIEIALQSLGIVGPRPNYESFWNRKPEEIPLGKPDVSVTTTQRQGLKENDNVILQITRTVEYNRLGSRSSETPA
jgi:hypothetical protein